MSKHIAILLIASALLAACGSSTTVALPTPVEIAPTPAAQAGAEEGGPAALDALHTGVDDIFALAPAGNWPEVAAEVGAMTEAWYAHGPEVSAAGASQAALNALDAALVDLAAKSEAQDTLGTLQAANLTAAAVADLYEVYQPAPASDFQRLVMLERQLWLDAHIGDAQITQGDLAQLRLIWERVAPMVRAGGGDELADQFDASLAAQAQMVEAGDADGLKTEVERVLEMVRQAQ